MAQTFKVGIGDLVAEFFAHTLKFRTLSDATRAIPVLCLQTFLYDPYDFFVVVESYLHNALLLQSRRDGFFHFFHIDGRLETRDHLAFSVHEELGEIPLDIRFVAVLFVVHIGKLF